MHEESEQTEGEERPRFSYTNPGGVGTNQRALGWLRILREGGWPDQRSRCGRSTGWDLHRFECGTGVRPMQQLEEGQEGRALDEEDGFRPGGISCKTSRAMDDDSLSFSLKVTYYPWQLRCIGVARPSADGEPIGVDADGALAVRSSEVLVDVESDGVAVNLEDGHTVAVGPGQYRVSEKGISNV